MDRKAKIGLSAAAAALVAFALAAAATERALRKW